MTAHARYDIIGDVHGCFDELLALMAQLDAMPARNGERRQLVFVGDLINRGPRPLDVVDQVMSLVEQGRALCVLGNHEAEFLAWLDGRAADVGRLTPTIEQWPDRSSDWRTRAKEFLRGLPAQLVLDDGRLCIAHAGLHEGDQNRQSTQAFEAAVFGRHLTADRKSSILNWSDSYTGSANVIHGHLPIAFARQNGKVWNIDTGCCFGGYLSALRYPEGTLISVPAHSAHADLPADFYASGGADTHSHARETHIREPIAQG